MTLRCITFNCRGWNNGKSSILDLLPWLIVIFIQEHWLSHDQLCVISDISSDFVAYGVSGMNPYELLLGHPYGGCA